MADRIAPNRVAYVVLGMHRSGTSSVAGTLALLGAAAPRTLMRPAEVDPALLDACLDELFPPPDADPDQRRAVLAFEAARWQGDGKASPTALAALHVAFAGGARWADDRASAAVPGALPPLYPD